MINLRDFRARVTRPQRTSKYEVSLVGGFDLPEDLRLFAEAVTFPTFKFSPLDVRRYGFGLPDPVATKPEYTEVIVDFIMEQGGYPYPIFKNWIEFISPMMVASTGETQSVERDLFTTEYKDNYVAKMYLKALPDTGIDAQSLTWELTDVFPTSITGEPFQWSSDEYHSFQVVLKFYRMSIVSGAPIIRSADTAGPDIDRGLMRELPAPTGVFDPIRGV